MTLGPMKLRFLLIICASLALTALAGDTPVKPSRQVARYRLHRAPVTAVEGRVKIEMNCVFKIDSQTGDTWIYRCAHTTNGSMEGWDKIPELTITPGARAAFHVGSTSIDALSTFLQWAEKNKNGTSDYTAEQIAKRRAEVEAYIRDAIPKP